jgi:hypothetical protein
MSLDLSELSAIIYAYNRQGVDKTLGGNRLYVLYSHLYDILYKRYSEGFNPDLVESEMNQVGSFLISLSLWLPDQVHVPLWHKLLNFSNSVNVLAQGVLLDSPIGKDLSNVADAFNRYAIMAYNYEVSLFQEKQLWEQVKTHEKNLELRADAATEGAALFASIVAAEAAETPKLQESRICVKCRQPSGMYDFCENHYSWFLAKAHGSPKKCPICNGNKGNDMLPMCKSCIGNLNNTTLNPLKPGQSHCPGGLHTVCCVYMRNGTMTTGADCCQACNYLNAKVPCKGVDGKLCVYETQTGNKGERYAHYPACAKCNSSAKTNSCVQQIVHSLDESVEVSVKEWVRNRESLWQQRRQQLGQQKRQQLGQQKRQ